MVNVLSMPALTGAEASEDALTLKIHAATLNNGFLDIPSKYERLLLEIGSSDRNTMDVDFLPKNNDTFLVTCEPLIDKCKSSAACAHAELNKFHALIVHACDCVSRAADAKALVRNTDRQTFDKFQPLGRHHARGLILPLAVGPEEGQLTFHVGSNSGCSSLLSIDKSSKRLAWCRQVAQRRLVPSVTLKRLLSWLPRPTVEFLKIDAQGMDMQIVASGGPKVSERVRRVSMEVISDDCDGLYKGQPKCTEVVKQMADLGYAPAGPVACMPHVKRGRQSSACEIEILFVAEGAGVPDPAYYEYHDLRLNGCVDFYKPQELEVLSSPAFLKDSERVIRGPGPRGGHYYYSSTGRAVHSAGAEYSCMLAEGHSAIA